MTRFARFAGFFLIAWSAPAAADVFTFETPSGNIVCSVGVGEGLSDISCTIYEREGSPVGFTPPGCTATSMLTVTLYGRGPADMVCEERRPNSGGYEVAGYGVRGTWDGLSCLSTEAGLDCQNSQGFGFFLSRRTQRIY